MPVFQIPELHLGICLTDPERKGCKIKFIQNQVKRAPSQSVFLDRTYFLHFKFNRVEFICNHCPIQPLEMKGLPFNERCAFYCGAGTQCPCLVILQGCIEHRGHTDSPQTRQTCVYTCTSRLGQPSFCSQWSVRWQK